jgi:exopolysaccharide biosynthesis polyprenyl glycosylphosphotransferase
LLAVPEIGSVPAFSLSATHRARLVAMLVTGDLAVVCGAAFACAAFSDHPAWAVLLAAACASAGFVGAGHSRGMHDVTTPERLRRAGGVAMWLGSVVVAVAMIAAFAIDGAAQGARVAAIGAAAVLGAAALRLALTWLLDRYGALFAERVLLVGMPDAVFRLLAADGRGDGPRRFVGAITIGTDKPAPFAPLAAIHPRHDDLDAVAEDVRRVDDALRRQPGRIDRAVIVAAGLDPATRAATLGRLEHLPFEIALLPEGAPHGQADDPLARGNCPTLHRAAITPWGLVCKRALDIAGAATLLVILAPVLLIIAGLIRHGSPGPALFRQTRWGRNNEPFTMFKFRSMWVNAHATDGSVQATRGDRRVTPIGGFLRRTSLDELPQLLNVLNGTMSLVGPRPHPVELNLRYLRLIEGYAARHRLPPGITGLAQIKGLRGETGTNVLMQKRVEYDLEYIRTRSFAADIRILFLTVASVIRGANAY